MIIRDAYGNVLKEGDFVSVILANPTCRGQILKLVNSGILQNPNPKAKPIGTILLTLQIDLELDGQPLQAFTKLVGPPTPTGGVQ